MVYMLLYTYVVNILSRYFNFFNDVAQGIHLHVYILIKLNMSKPKYGDCCKLA
jgi:hypothetical protein